MSDDWFEKMKTNVPQFYPLPDNVSTPFWENMYQAFKARMEKETNNDR